MTHQVANHVPLNARVIGANEHESQYVFDLLHNNTTDIQPSIHSTDTHGTNLKKEVVLHEAKPPIRLFEVKCLDGAIHAPLYPCPL